MRGPCVCGTDPVPMSGGFHAGSLCFQDRTTGHAGQENVHVSLCLLFGGWVGYYSLQVYFQDYDVDNFQLYMYISFEDEISKFQIP